MTAIVSSLTLISSPYFAMPPEILLLPLLFGAAFVAGLVDAIAGGGLIYLDFN